LLPTAFSTAHGDVTITRIWVCYTLLHLCSDTSTHTNESAVVSRAASSFYDDFVHNLPITMAVMQNQGNGQKSWHMPTVFAVIVIFLQTYCSKVVVVGWLGSRVVSVLDSGAEGPGFESQSRRCRVTALGKLFTPIVPLFTKQRNW